MENSTPGLPFRVAGSKGERLPTLYPEHLARRRRRVPGAALGTVSPTALFSLCVQNEQHFPFGGLAELIVCAHHSRKQCCGEFHSRATLSSNRFQGRTPPNAVPRTPCPKAKARTGRSARHGLPHSTVFAVLKNGQHFALSDTQVGGPQPGSCECDSVRPAPSGTSYASLQSPTCPGMPVCPHTCTRVWQHRPAPTKPTVLLVLPGSLLVCACLLLYTISNSVFWLWGLGGA